MGEQARRIIKTGWISSTLGERNSRFANRDKGTSDCIDNDTQGG